MKFKLEIKLGNEAMQSLDDVFSCLEAMSANHWSMQPPEGDEDGNIFDINGNRVGKWYITEAGK